MRSSFIFVGLAAVAHGAVVVFFDEQNCQGNSHSRNIYDNSCATGTGGYQSFSISVPGGSSQVLTAYNRDACAGINNNCVAAGGDGVTDYCYNALGSNGGSNAMSSSSSCGLA